MKVEEVRREYAAKEQSERYTRLLDDGEEVLREAQDAVEAMRHARRFDLFHAIREGDAERAGRLLIGAVRDGLMSRATDEALEDAYARYPEAACRSS